MDRYVEGADLRPVGGARGWRGVAATRRSCSKMRSMNLGAVIKATIRISSPHRGQASGSTSNRRRSNAAGRCTAVVALEHLALVRDVAGDTGQELHAVQARLVESVNTSDSNPVAEIPCSFQVATHVARSRRVDLRAAGGRRSIRSFHVATCMRPQLGVTRLPGERCCSAGTGSSDRGGP